MTPKDFLRSVAAVCPALAGPRAGQLAVLAPRLAADFRPDQLTAAAADKVAAALRGVPTYPDLAALVRGAVGPAEPKREKPEEEKTADMWEDYVRRRLSEGGPAAHLRSLLRAYCPAPFLPRAMMDLFPREWEDEMAVEQERRTSKAAAVAKALADAKRMPRTPVSAAPPPPPKPRPPAGHVRPEVLAEMRRAQGITVPGPAPFAEAAE